MANPHVLDTLSDYWPGAAPAQGVIDLALSSAYRGGRRLSNALLAHSKYRTLPKRSVAHSACGARRCDGQIVRGGLALIAFECQLATW